MRPKRAIGHEGFADLIANDLEFAQLPMRRVHAERRIVDRERERARSLGITVVGTRQFLLQPHEQCVGAADRLVRQRHNGRALRHQQSLQHLPLTAERHGQRMRGG